MSPPTVPNPTSSSSSAPATESRQQCWECLRRRWVCDASRPVCNKCRTAGIVCPGYSNQKPLVWLAPGRVTSRTRRQQPQNGKNRRKSSATGNKASGNAARKTSSSTGQSNGSQSDGKVTIKVERGERVSSPVKIADEGMKPLTFSSNPPVRNSKDDTVTEAPQSAIYPDRLPVVDDIGEAMQYYNSQIYPSLVLNQLAPSPFVVPITNTDVIPTSLRHALISMTVSHRIHRLPRRESCSPRSSIASANSSSSPTSSATCESVGSMASARSSVTSTSCPRGSITSVTSNRGSITAGSGSRGSIAEDGGRITTRRGVNCNPADMWGQVHHHMGLAIRALNEELSTDSSRSSDATIISVLVFIIAELQQSISPHWRPHVNGLMALITLRGGLGVLVDSAAHLKPALLSFTILAVIANTTSPPADQISASTHLNMIDLISELYSVGIFPSLPCPLPLFLDIIHVNYLRFKIAKDPMACLEESVQAAAALILRRINTFSSDSWIQAADDGSYPEEWRLIARIFQSAVALYAISTLPWADLSGSLLADNSTTTSEGCDLEVMKSVHRARLFAFLGVALESPVVQKGMVWPLVVAGIEAAVGSREERGFIEHHFASLSRSTGTLYPLVAKGALEKFWAAGLMSWDNCFDQPYAILA